MDTENLLFSKLTNVYDIEIVLKNYEKCVKSI